MPNEQQETRIWVRIQPLKLLFEFMARLMIVLLVISSSTMKVNQAIGIIVTVTLLIWTVKPIYYQIRQVYSGL